MSCCGKSRIGLDTTTRYRPPSAPAVPVRAQTFQYIGYTSLTVRGPITGHTYYFAGAGATLSIDARDAPSLMTVPHLRRAVPHR